MEQEQEQEPKFTKLHFDKTLSQEKRRQLTLEWQKKRRDHVVDSLRQLEGDSGLSGSETEEEEGMSLDFVDNMKPRRERKPANKFNPRWRQHQVPSRIMQSEWLIQKPDDFEDQWLGVLCPAGKRTLVVASRGKTKAYSRREEYLGCFSSLLPGGRKSAYNAGNRGRGVTILDCVYSEESKTFYILDVLCWNSHSCINCDFEYRQFLLLSKFEENQDLAITSVFNHVAFKPLPYFPAGETNTIMTSVFPPFPEQVDGVLYVYKQAFYIPDVNPLCLWVRLTGMAQRLGIDVNPELLAKEMQVRERPQWNKNNKTKKDGGRGGRGDSVGTETEPSN